MPSAAPLSSENPSSLPYALGMFTRFPSHWMLENRRVESAVAKAIWLMVPFQYYVLTSFNSGFSTAAYIPAAMTALGYLLAIFAMACILALLWRPIAPTFELRMRIWASSLIVMWAASLMLLTASYFVGKRTVQEDFVGYYVCVRDFVDCQGTYPSYELRTWMTYFIYSIVACVVVRGAQVAWDRLVRRSTVLTHAWAEPNALVVILANMLLMTLIYGGSTWPWR